MLWGLRAIPERILILFLGFWKLCLSFVPLATGMCMQILIEASKGIPEKESVLLIPQHWLLSFALPPPIPDRLGLLFLKPHLTNRCLYLKPRPGVVQYLHRAFWFSGTAAYTITRPPFQSSVNQGRDECQQSCLPRINSLECLAGTRPDSQLNIDVEEVNL